MDKIIEIRTRARRAYGAEHTDKRISETPVIINDKRPSLNAAGRHSGTIFVYLYVSNFKGPLSGTQIKDCWQFGNKDSLFGVRWIRTFCIGNTVKFCGKLNNV